MCTTIDWGSVPDWLAAIVAGLSFAVAAVVYRNSVVDKEKDQAARVSAWLSEGDEGHVLNVRNASGGVIYDVVALNYSPREELDFRTIPPETTVTRGLPAPPSGRTVVPIRFRDGVGRYWRRDEHGRLTGFGGPELSLEDAKRFKLFR